MALITCNECGKLVSEQATSCPNCGAPIGSTSNNQQVNHSYTPQPSAPRNNTGLIVVIVVLVALICAMGGYFIYSKQQHLDEELAAAKAELEATTAQKAQEAEKAQVEAEPAKVEAAPAPAPAKAAPATKSQLEVTTTAPVAAAPTSEIWKGAIGGKYKVHMKIDVDNGEFYYYYDKYGSNNRLWLTCVASSGNSITLVETTEYGEQTGMFDGRINGNAFTGTFTNFASGKSYNFRLTRQ